MQKEKILILGDTGFIGKHLKKSLKDFYRISGFSRNKGDDMQNIKHIIKKTKGADAVLHFASAAVGRKKMKEHPEAVSVDFKGINNIAQIVLKMKSFLIYPSSILVYGKSNRKKLTEKSPLNSNDIYGKLKIKSEKLIKSLGEKFDNRYIIIRLATVYGPGMPQDSLLALFFQKAIKGEPLIISGPGTEKRNFLYIDDVCSAFRQLLKRRKDIKGNIFNICHSRTITVKELALLIIKITKSRSKVIHTSVIPPPDQAISNEKIRKKINWRPTISMNEGLKKMFLYYLRRKY